LRESYLTISPSNKGADLPIRGIVGVKIDYLRAKLNKMYKVLAINRDTNGIKLLELFQNHSKNETTVSMTLETSESLKPGCTGRLKDNSVKRLALGQSASNSDIGA